MQKDTASLKREQSEIREDRCERKACLNLLPNKNGLWVLNGNSVFPLPSQINPWQSAAEREGVRGGGEGEGLLADTCMVFLNPSAER